MSETASTAMDEIREFFAANPGKPLARADIASATAIQADTVSSCLFILKKRGHIRPIDENAKPCQYVLADAPQAPAPPPVEPPYLLTEEAPEEITIAAPDDDDPLLAVIRQGPVMRDRSLLLRVAKRIRALAFAYEDAMPGELVTALREDADLLEAAP